MIRQLLLISLTLVLPFGTILADEPSLNGRTMSEWIAILKDDPLVRKRKAALVSLGQMLPGTEELQKKAIPAIAKSLKVDGNAGVRAQAAILLGQQPVESAPLFLNDLTEALRSEKDSEVRKELAIAIGRFGRLSGAAVLPLIEVLKDPAFPTRAAAAETLGRIGKDARKSAPYLIPLVKDPDRTVRLAAIFAIGRVDPDDSETAAEVLVEALQAEQAKMGANRDQEAIVSAIVSLGLLGEKSTDAVKAIARHLSDTDVELRQLATQTLSKFGVVSRIASAELKKVFQEDSDKLTRSNALHALGVAYGMDVKELIPVLVSRLKSEPEYEIRVGICELLASFGANGKSAIPALQEARRDSQLKVREAAALAIRTIEKPAEKPKP